LINTQVFLIWNIRTSTRSKKKIEHLIPNFKSYSCNNVKLPNKALKTESCKPLKTPIKPKLSLIEKGQENGHIPSLDDKQIENVSTQSQNENVLDNIICRPVRKLIKLMKKESQEFNKSEPKDAHSRRKENDDCNKSMKMFNMFGKTNYLKFISRFDKDDQRSMTEISQKIYNIHPLTKKEFRIMEFISENHDQDQTQFQHSPQVSPQRRLSPIKHSLTSFNKCMSTNIKVLRKESSSKSNIVSPISKASSLNTNSIRQSNKSLTSTKGEQHFARICNDVFHKSQEVLKKNHKIQEVNGRSLHAIFNRNLSEQNYRYNDDSVNQIKDTEMSKYLHNRDFIYGSVRGHSLENNRKLF